MEMELGYITTGMKMQRSHMHKGKTEEGGVDPFDKNACC